MFIGLGAMPPIPVDAKSGTYPKVQIAEGELMTPLATERTSTGSYGEVTRKWGTDTYDCVDRGLEEAVGDVDQKDLLRFFNYEASAANWVRRNVMLAHEVRVATEIFSTGNFGAGTNSVVAYAAANLATMDFPQDVIAAIERVANNGQVANTIILSSTVAGEAGCVNQAHAVGAGPAQGQL